MAGVAMGGPGARALIVQIIGQLLFLYKQLDTIVQGMPSCLRALAVAAVIEQMAKNMVLSHTLILYTSHQVAAILHNLNTQHMTTQRRSGNPVNNSQLTFFLIPMTHIGFVNRKRNMTNLIKISFFVC